MNPDPIKSTFDDFYDMSPWGFHTNSYNPPKATLSPPRAKKSKNKLKAQKLARKRQRKNKK